MNKTCFSDVNIAICRKHKKDRTVKKSDINEKLLAMEHELFMYAKALTHEENRAADLLQETNLKILLSYESFRGGAKFRNWAMKIMRNSFLNNVKHEDKVTVVEDYNKCRHDMMYMPGRGDIVNGTHDIYCAVDNLPDDLGRTMRLLITGHKYDEIAIMLNLPVGTVKSRIYNSRVILKKQLKVYLE